MRIDGTIGRDIFRGESAGTNGCMPRVLLTGRVMFCCFTWFTYISTTEAHTHYAWIYFD